VGAAQGCVLPVERCVECIRPGFRWLWLLKTAGSARAGEHRVLSAQQLSALASGKGVGSYPWVSGCSEAFRVRC